MFKPITNKTWLPGCLPYVFLVCLLSTLGMPNSVFGQAAKSLQLQPQDYSSFQAKEFSQTVKNSLQQIGQTVNRGPFQPTWSSLEKYEIPTWYKDAKFGIFIHWGVYSVPEFGWEWYPRQMYINRKNWRENIFQHHLMVHGSQDKFGYKDFIPGLTTEKFDAEQWVRLFKESGARYVVPVAEHHDGFAMYDCEFTQWSAVKMGPKRDVINELAMAVRKSGLRFGVSNHRAFNWVYYVRNKNFDSADPRFDGLYGRSMPELFKEDAWDYKKNWPDHDEEFKDEWLARNCELVDKYQPDLFWFDFGINHIDGRSPEDNPFADHLKRFAAYYYNHAANENRVPVLNYKWTAFPEKAAVLDLERSKLDDIRPLFWQTDTSIADNSWSYVENLKYKTADRLIDDLVDIVSKNGCLLLNVAPQANGEIPAEQQVIMKEIGAWLKINGEAIYGTRPFTVFGEGPTKTETGHLSEAKNKSLGSKDIRFTLKGDLLYAIALGVPATNQIVVKTLRKPTPKNSSAKPVFAKRITQVELLGSNAKLTWEQNASGLVIELPATLPSQHALTFKISK